MPTTRGTKKCGTTISSTLRVSNNVANSGESTESGMEAVGSGAGCDGGMG